MTLTHHALLDDRGVVSVSGEDAGKLLQGIITNDMDLLDKQPAIHTALLTPQGKILFEFFVAKSGPGYLLDVARSQTADLIKRLTMYKLRAKVDIKDMSADYRVIALWGSAPASDGETSEAISFTDPRLEGLGLRVLAQAPSADAIASATGATEATAADYDAHRIALGIPEITKDYPPNDTFADEANLDALESVSFTKGCFIGQEVASRMEHRGTARTRAAIVESGTPLAPSGKITAGAATIGTIGSAAGNRAIALARLDRADEAEAKGQPLTADGAAVTLRRPAYLKSKAAPAT
jgi:folate-binding protein YgfZ